MPCSDGYVPLYREGLFIGHAGGQVKGCQAARPIDYPSLHLPVCEQVCSDTVWLEQYLLLSDPAEMDDIATAIARIQSAWA